MPSDGVHVMKKKKKKTETTYCLIVERLNDPLAAFSGNKHHLSNEKRLRLDNLTADHFAAYRRHGTLDISCSCPGSKILAQESIRTGETADGEAPAGRGLERGSDDVDLVGVHLVHSSDKLGLATGSSLGSGIAVLGAGNSDAGAQGTAFGWYAVDRVVEVVCPFAIDVASGQTSSASIGSGSGGGGGGRGALLHRERKVHQQELVSNFRGHGDMHHGCLKNDYLLHSDAARKGAAGRGLEF